MNKKVFSYFLILLIVVAFVSLRWNNRDDARESAEKNSECACPSLDELLMQEMPEASMKLEAAMKGEEKNIALSSEETAIQEDKKNGIRILLRYEDRGSLLERAKMYGLTTRKESSLTPYYFSLDEKGERLYFVKDESFKKFLSDIGGRGILAKAKNKIVVRLASDSHFELLDYR